MFRQIEDTCREVCKQVFKDRKKRKARAEALFKLGKKYKAASNAAKKAIGKYGK